MRSRTPRTRAETNSSIGRQALPRARRASRLNLAIERARSGRATPRKLAKFVPAPLPRVRIPRSQSEIPNPSGPEKPAVKPRVHAWAGDETLRCSSYTAPRAPPQGSPAAFQGRGDPCQTGAAKQAFRNHLDDPVGALRMSSAVHGTWSVPETAGGTRPVPTTDGIPELFLKQPFTGRGTGSLFGPFGFFLRQRQTAEQGACPPGREGERPMFAAKRCFQEVEPSPPRKWGPSPGNGYQTRDNQKPVGVFRTYQPPEWRPRDSPAEPVAERRAADPRAASSFSLPRAGPHGALLLVAGRILPTERALGSSENAPRAVSPLQSICSCVALRPSSQVDGG